LQERSPFEVLLVAETLDPVTASGGMRVLPDIAFEDCPELDLLVVPGGMGARREMANEVLLGFLRAQAGSAELVASVCTGSLLLGKAGLLEGLRATTHWASLDLMRQLFPGTQVDAVAHVVDEGRILTSAGISAGIDLALRIVARCCGEEVARAAARRMEYPFPEGNGRRVRLGDLGPLRVDFDALPWTSPMEGVRCKIHAEGDRRLRLVEYASAMPPHWCAKGHVGCILDGEFEIEFERGTIVYRPGDGVFIPDGPEHRHRARTLTDTVTALFVESV
ncbi:MAG TPA: DJ-1/PfpI family protein, partial [Holophaga sp.]|nr:DJ-1/PfpI family protein [Holophaga sp.]